MSIMKKALSLFLAVILVLSLSSGALAAPAGSGRTAPPVQLPAELIFRQSVNAVFMLETFGRDGKSIRTGSGFFITGAGLAVTNLHVLENASTATITLYNGDVFPLRGVHATSKKFNLAIISIESDADDWDHLTLGDSSKIEPGNSVYVIGSPLELINTMTQGIISHKRRDVSGEILIQFTAPISFGSGGSPVLNAYGQVIGIASSSFSYGQNLNLAVPANHIKTLTPSEFMPLDSLLP